jgi:hypothetical protein
VSLMMMYRKGRNMRREAIAALLVAAVLDACGPGGEGPRATVPGRSYRLASAGVQAFPGTDLLYQITPADVATDADVVAVHEEFYGIPWDEFEANQPPPDLWVAKMDELAALGPSRGKDVYLALLIGREWLADKTTVVGGRIQRAARWSARCYDFATAADGAAKRAAYARYVAWMVERFQPRWVNVAVEMNAFLSACPGAWPGMVAAERAAYDAAKAAKPDAIVFASFQIDALMGYSACPAPRTQPQCYDENYAQLADVKRDRFGVSTYPYLLEPYRRASDVPSDWFTRAASRGGERAIVAETGWITDPDVALLGTTCATALTSDETEAAAYLDLLLAAAEAQGIELVTWWSDRDLMPLQAMTECPCAFDATWCAAEQIVRAAAGTDPLLQFTAEAQFKMWGTMGLRRYAGTPKPVLMQRWSAARALPIR